MSLVVPMGAWELTGTCSDLQRWTLGYPLPIGSVLSQHAVKGVSLLGEETAFARGHGVMS